MTYHPIATTLLALCLATSAAHAQHEVTARWHSPSNDSATLTLTGSNVVAAELFTGPQLDGRAIFNAAGSDGDLSFAHLSSTSHYSVVTLRVTAPVQSWNFNVDQIGAPFSAEATGLNAYVGMRLVVTWGDGFETYIPMSHSPFSTDNVFTYTDIPPVPEPGTGALALAGLALVTAGARRARRD